MAKRFTDSRKWDDDWFLELSKDYKLLWIYLLDKCDHAGIFKPNMKLLNFSLDSNYKLSDIIEVFNDRLQTISNGKLFIPKFISFQYGDLKNDSPFHRKIAFCLKAQGVSIPYQESVNTLKEEKEVKVKEEIKIKNNIYKGDFETIWKKYPSRVGKKAAERHFIATIKSEADYNDIQKALQNYLLSDRVKKGFVQDGKTWFNNWRDWVNTPESKVVSKAPGTTAQEIIEKFKKEGQNEK